jgi:threonine synthase
MEAHIFMPRDVPQSNFLECKAYGAKVTLVDGLISDCGRIVAERGPAEGWFDVSTLKEPYRIEGKKTMGYEVAEQMGWELPDAIFYPTGGGVGMIGMWKAFDEMERLGWIGSRRPKMVAVQAEGCQPVVRAFQENEPRSRFYEDARTVAAGLRVPKPLGDFLVLRAVRESGGTAIAVSDNDMLEAGLELASDEGIYAAPEGAACVAAARQLIACGFLKATDRIVLYNTGSGLKYPEAYSTRFARSAAGEQDKLGGLITPR